MAPEVDSGEEPRLKYSALSPDTSIPGTALLLAVSDKVLALGTSTGAVLVLDYNGNQVATSDAIDLMTKGWQAC